MRVTWRTIWVGWLSLVLVSALATADEPKAVTPVDPAAPPAVSSVQPDPTVIVTGDVQGTQVPYEIQVGRGTRQRAYSILSGPTTESQQELYNRLTPEEKESFEYKRLSTLKAIAGTLNTMPGMVGAVAATGSSLSKLFGGQKETGASPRGPPDETKISPTLRDRGFKAIQTLLLAVDSQLFDRAPIIANANEFGFGAFAGLGAGAMLGNRGWGEGQGLGIYIGYSPALRQMTLELYWGREQMQQATIVIKPPMVVWKLMASGFRRTGNEPAVTTRSRGVYPILIPVLGRVFLQDGAGAVHAGYANGLPLIPGTGSLAHLLNVVPAGTSLDGWTVKGTRVPLVRMYVQLPKDGQKFAVHFRSAVEFRKIFPAVWRATSPYIAAPFVATAQVCGWAWKQLVRLCGGKPCPTSGGSLAPPAAQAR